MPDGRTTGRLTTTSTTNTVAKTPSSTSLTSHPQRDPRGIGADGCCPVGWVDVAGCKAGLRAASRPALETPTSNSMMIISRDTPQSVYCRPSPATSQRSNVPTSVCADSTVAFPLTGDRPRSPVRLVLSPAGLACEVRRAGSCRVGERRSLAWAQRHGVCRRRSPAVPATTAVRATPLNNPGMTFSFSLFSGPHGICRVPEPASLERKIADVPERDGAAPDRPRHRRGSVPVGGLSEPRRPGTGEPALPHVVTYTTRRDPMRRTRRDR